MVGFNIPSRKSDGTNSITEIKEAMNGFDPKITKVTAGESVTLKAKLGISNDGSKVLWAEIDYTDKWFTLTNAKVNQSGEIEYTFITSQGKKTPVGSVVRHEINWSNNEGMVHGQNNTFWYQFT